MSFGEGLERSEPEYSFEEATTLLEFVEDPPLDGTEGVREDI
jgi:hypothetical protein